MTRSTTEAYQGTTWCRSLDRFNDVTGTNDVRAIRQYLSHTFSSSNKHRHCSLVYYHSHLHPDLWSIFGYTIPIYPNIGGQCWLYTVIHPNIVGFIMLSHISDILSQYIPIYCPRSPHVIGYTSHFCWLMFVIAFTISLWCPAGQGVTLPWRKTRLMWRAGTRLGRGPIS